MTGWIVFLSILLFFFLIFMLKASFIIGYDGSFKLALKILFIKIPLAPGKEKKIDLNYYSPDVMEKREKKKKEKDAEKKLKKEEKKKIKKAEKIAKKASGEKKKKMTFSEITDLIKMIYTAVVQLFSHLIGYIHTEIVKMDLSIAGGPPDKTAIKYGEVMAGLNLLCDFLDKKSNLKFRSAKNVCILPGFYGGFKADIEIIVSIRVWQVFGMIIPSAITALKWFIKRTMKKKDEEKNAEKENAAVDASKNNGNAPSGDKTKKGRTTPKGHKIG